jgi:predicted DNA-binding protein
MLSLADKDIEKRITALSKITGHKKSFLLREVINRSLDDIEDMYMALERLKNPEWVSQKEFEALSALDN